jgi:hypothetical protein
MIFSKLALVTLIGVAAVSCAEAQSLDFATFKSRVEPIFIKPRPGHARCVACHSAANNLFRLQPLNDGATAYTEEQSRKNFEVVSKLVNSSDPSKSIILIHPLAQDAGGDLFHSGGRQFTSKDDPDWKAIADWAAKR